MNYYLAFTIFIFILTVCLRFYKINKICLIGWDEASYFREARFMFQFLKFALDKKYRKLFFKPALSDHALHNKTPEEEAYLIQECAKQVMPDPLIYCKPANNFFIVLCYELFGINTMSVIIPNAVLGVLSVVVVFALGYYIGDLKTAIAAATVLSVSGAHVLFSRNGQVELKVGFFFSLAIFYYIILAQDFSVLPAVLLVTLIVFCGIFINFCGATSPLWYQPLLFALLGSDIVATLYCIKTTSLNHLGFMSLDIIVRIISIALITLAFVFVWEFPYLIQRTYFPYINSFSSYLETYFQRGQPFLWVNMCSKIFSIFTGMGKNKKHSAQSIEDNLLHNNEKIPFKLSYGLYAYHIFITEGPFVTFLLLASIVWIIFNPSYPQMFILTSFIMIFLGLSLISWRASRGALLIRPLIAVLTGSLLSDISNWNEYIFIASLIIIIIYGIINNIKYLTLKFSFKEAVEFVKNNGPEKFSSSNYRLAGMYDKDENLVNILKLELGKLLEYIKNGELKYFIVEMQSIHFFKHLDWCNEIIKKEPVFKIEDPYITEPSIFTEIEVTSPPFGDNLQFKIKPSEFEKHINVYDMEKFFFSAQEINEQGEELYAEDKREEAERKFRTAIEMKEDLVTAYNNLAVVLLAKGENDSALDIFEKAVKIDSSNYETVYNYITTAHKLNKTDRTKELIEIIKSMGVKDEDKESIETIISAINK